MNRTVESRLSDSEARAFAKEQVTFVLEIEHNLLGGLCEFKAPLDRLNRAKDLARLTFGMQHLQLEIVDRQPKKGRDAVLREVRGRSSFRKFLLELDPALSRARKISSILHETMHAHPAFLSTLEYRTSAGIPGDAVERWCDRGAAELAAPTSEVRAFLASGPSMKLIPKLERHFWISAELGVRRLAETHGNLAVGGLARYELAGPKATLPIEQHSTQPELPSGYRFASWSASPTFEDWQKEHVIWLGMPFKLSSSVYRAASEFWKPTTAVECLPNAPEVPGHIESVIAPFQPDGSKEHLSRLSWKWRTAFRR